MTIDKNKLARQIKLLNMSKDDFEKDIERYAKVFFPKNSKDLHPASSAKMMTEQAAVIGDILSFYLENRFKNANLYSAENIEQIYNLAQYQGYDPGGPPPGRGMTNFYLQVPATSSADGSTSPDMRYAAKFREVQVKSSNGATFEVLDDVDFSEVNPSSSTFARVSRRDDDGVPTHYVLRTSAEIIGARTVTETKNIGSYKAFREVEISEPNVVDILDVTDSDGNKYYEVNFLAEEAIFESVKNVGADADEAPYILKLKTVPWRFKRYTNPATGKTRLVFGAGKGIDVGDSFVPDPSELAVDLKGRQTFASEFIDPQNFLKTKTLGIAPYDTTLTIRARVGGGPSTNASEGTVRDIISKITDWSTEGLDVAEVNETLSSFSTNNTERISGGDNAETPREVKENAAAMFAAQGRLNTREDYIARSLSLPPKFGKIFRVSAATNCNSQGGVQLFVIAKNQLDQLTSPSNTLRNNLKNYLKKFTRLNQGIDILDGIVINLAIEYSIVVAPGLSKTKVKNDTLLKVREFFDIRKWQLNQSIVIDDIICEIKDVEGVVSVADIKIKNRSNTFEGRTYSSRTFGVSANTKNGIIYCPQNAIFEVKYRNGQDIKVAAI